MGSVNRMSEKQAKLEMGSVDRMSELPDFILHSILSFLDSKEACRVTVLSKYWYAAWCSIPVLDFRRLYFKEPRHYWDERDELEDWYDDGTDRHLVEYIDATMLRYIELKHRISKLYLQLPIVNKNIKHLVDKWIGIAVQNHVEELSFASTFSQLPYRLPEIIFSAKSLKVLNCVNVSLPYYETMDRSSLESLTLIGVNVETEMLQRIVSFCPLIDLNVTSGSFGGISLPWVEKGFETTRGFGGGSAQSDVKTSMLRRFVYTGMSWRLNVNVGALRNLIKVEITDAEITDDIVYEMAAGLVALESLILSSCKLLRRIEISNFSLKEFHITQGDDLKRVKIDAPNLLEFGFNCGVKTSVFLVRAHDNCNPQFIPLLDCINTSWFLTLKKFLLETNIFKSLVVDLGEDIGQIDVRELKNSSTCAPYKLRELKLQQLRYSVESTLTDILDGLFWSCHPDVLSITGFQSSSAKSTEFILNFLKHKVQCWKHPLKSIEVEGVDLSSLFTTSAELEMRFGLSWKSF